MIYKNLKWLNESQYHEIDNGIEIYAPEHTDYFVNPVNHDVITSAPFLYQEVTGDFILRAKVSHDFLSTYDACVLLAQDHDRLWAKACFELTDIGTHSIVTVMTNEHSDDANGVIVDTQEIWLQLARKDNMFAIHYSLDGRIFSMARLTYLPMRKTIKVGFSAQSPLGDGGMRCFTNILFKKKRLRDIRNGNDLPLI